MNFGNKRLILGFCAAILPATALGWSSKSSRTENEVFNLKNAILTYYVEHREYPDISTLFEDLVESKVWFPRKEEKRIADSWGNELVVRIPGTHEWIDVHSVGPDGIDQSGAGDDVSSWSGVNDGYHYKRTWPLGRAVLFGFTVLGVAVLFLGCWLKWPFVLSVVGMVICSGLIFGCRLLQHPGMMPDRNGPLEMTAFAAGISLLALVFFVVLFCRRETPVRQRRPSIPRARRTPPPHP